MTDQQPEQPAEAVAPPPSAPHTPIVDRVTNLEDRLTQLIDHHNSFVGDVVTELGL